MSENVAEFAVSDRIRVIALPNYVKTAEPMPMLRPPSVIAIGEEGIILSREPGEYWGIRFEKGAFLLESQYFEAANPPNLPQDEPDDDHAATQDC
jgi:hypothetical protein